MLASRLHWRLLIGTILVLMAAAWLAPRFVPEPALQENRVLAPPPAWPKRLQDIHDFRKGADPYVADHFPARPQLIGALNRLRLLVGASGSGRVIIGRHGWLFFDDDSHLGGARGDPPMVGPEVRAWLLTLAGRTEAMRARGVAYLAISPPVKEAVYPQHAPAWFGRPNPDRAAISLPRLAHDTGAGEVLYLYPQVAEATRRGEPTYSRHDTHWTGYGAYAGYVALMDRLHAMGLTEGPRPRSDFSQVDLHPGGIPRDLALMLGVSSFVDLAYPHLDSLKGDPKITITYLTAKQDWTAPQVIDTGIAGKPVLLMTRDSFSNELLPFLLPHFSRIVLSHNQDGFWRTDLVERFKPDIVLLEVIEPGLRGAFGVGPAPSATARARIDHVLGALPPSAPGASVSAMPTLTPPDAKTLAALTAARATPNCNIEIATLTPGIGGEATLTASGWLSEFTRQVTSPEGFVALSGPGGRWTAPVRLDKSRPDVAAFYKNTGGLQSGFVGTWYIRKLPPGAYSAYVYRRAGPGWIACPGKQPLTAP